MRLAMDGESQKEEAKSSGLIQQQVEADIDKYIPLKSFFEKRAEVQVENYFFEKKVEVNEMQQDVTVEDNLNEKKTEVKVENEHPVEVSAEIIDPEIKLLQIW